MSNDDEDARTIWCGNLSEKVTHDILYELFFQAGPLDRVRIPQDREGRQRNFGFITYMHEESVPYAVNLFKGTALFDRTLSMQMQKAPRNNGNYNRDYPAKPSRYMDTPQLNMELEQKFVAMTNQMITTGAPMMPNYDMYDNYAQNRPHQLSVASLQGQWTSRHHPYDKQNSSDSYRERDRSRRSDRDRSWGYDGRQERSYDYQRQGRSGHHSRSHRPHNRD